MIYMCSMALGPNAIPSQELLYETNSPDQVNRRQFVLDLLDRKVDTNSNHAWVVARLISERLDTNRAFQAFLLNEPRRVFDALPVKPFRSTDAPLLWDKAMVEVRRVGTSGAEIGVRVSSKDGADQLTLITAGGTNHYLKTIENANHHCSLDETLEQGATKLIRSPMANAAAEKTATNLFRKLTAHYGYRPVELLPPTVNTTNCLLITMNSESGKEVSQNARIPCWTVTFYSRTNHIVQGSWQGDGVPEQIGFFSFAPNPSDKTWMPVVMDLYACPRANPGNPLVELADTFLEPNWAETIYEDFMANPSKVAREATGRSRDNPYLRRTLRGPLNVRSR